MSAIDVADRLTRAAGVIAAGVLHAKGPPDFRGDERWRRALEICLGLPHLTGGMTLTIALSRHTITVQCESDLIVAAVVMTGDPIGKSLRRLMRRASQRAIAER